MDVTDRVAGTLLRLPPRCASASDSPTLLAELAHVRSDYAGITKAVRERDCRGDHAKAQHCGVGRLVSLIGYRDIAGPQPSVGDRIGDEIGESETDRADELAHLQSR